MKLSTFSLALLLTVMAHNSHAYTSTEFLKKCETAHKAVPNEKPQQSVNRALDFGACTGFVGGVVSGVDLIGNLLRSQKAIKQNFICLPPNKPANELLQEVISYIKQNQKSQGNAPAQLSIYNALAPRYRCSPSKGAK